MHDEILVAVKSAMEWPVQIGREIRLNLPAKRCPKTENKY